MRPARRKGDASTCSAVEPHARGEAVALDRPGPAGACVVHVATGSRGRVAEDDRCPARSCGVPERSRRVQSRPVRMSRVSSLRCARPRFRLGMVVSSVWLTGEPRTLVHIGFSSGRSCPAVCHSRSDRMGRERWMEPRLRTFSSRGGAITRRAEGSKARWPASRHRRPGGHGRSHLRALVSSGTATKSGHRAGRRTRRRSDPRPAIPGRGCDAPSGDRCTALMRLLPGAPHRGRSGEQGWSAAARASRTLAFGRVDLVRGRRGRSDDLATHDAESCIDR